MSCEIINPVSEVCAEIPTEAVEAAETTPTLSYKEKAALRYNKGPKNIPFPLVDTSVSTKVWKSLKPILSTLIFRRVGEVHKKEICGGLYEDANGIIEFNKQETLKMLDRTNEEGWSPAEIKQNVTLLYNHWTATTEAIPQRSNDRIKGPIFLNMNNYSELNWEKLVDCPNGKTIGWTGKSRQNRPPLIQNQGRMIMKELVCMLVSPPKQKGQLPFAQRWFYCSEQFLRAWTLIMYTEHDTFDKYIPPPSEKLDDEEEEYLLNEAADIYRRKVFAGNHVCTNNYRKYILGCEDNGQEPDDEEIRKRFYRFSYEKPAREWCHFYAALVLIIRYKEQPTNVKENGYGNVPNNLSGELYNKRWDLPEWFEHFIADLCIAYKE